MYIAPAEQQAIIILKGNLIFERKYRGWGHGHGDQFLLYFEKI